MLAAEALAAGSSSPSPPFRPPPVSVRTRMERMRRFVSKVAESGGRQRPRSWTERASAGMSSSSCSVDSSSLMADSSSTAGK